jgi:valyl-tRNA synthetase
MSATALAGQMEILVPMAGLIDKQAEVNRLQKETERLQKECERISGKLSNESFVAKAPADVIHKEREKLSDAESALSKLREQIDAINAL